MSSRPSNSQLLFHTAVFQKHPRLIRLSAIIMVLLLLLGAAVGVVNSSTITGETTATRSLEMKMGPMLHPYRVIPTISIISVEKGESVTFRTHNYPPNQTFTVYMGKMYTKGIGGENVGTFSSGAGGSFEVTMDIPESLKDDTRIAIRAQTAHKHPYFSFNWFDNNEAEDDNDDNDDEDGMQGGADDPADDDPADDDPADDDDGKTAVYRGIPTFKICSVDKNNSVTIVTKNFPPNQTFTVTMGKMHTRGIRGTVVGTIESGEGNAQNVTFDIPAHLQGHGRISIRAQTAHKHPYFAYNWFYNNTANVC